MLTLFKKLAIVDANDLTTSVVVPNINAEVEGASSFFYDREKTTFQVEDEQELIYKLIHTIDAVGMPYSGISISTLESLVGADTDVLISAVGVDGGLVWHEPTKIDWREHPKEVRAWKFMSRIASYPHYVPDTGYVGGGVHVGENLLSLYQWADNDGDNTPQGWNSINLSNESFSGGQHSFDVSDTSSDLSASLVFDKIFFPFEGETITFSFSIDAYTGDDAINESVELRYYDDTGSVIGAETVSSNFNATGRASVTDQIPSGAVKVEPRLIFFDNGGDNAGQGSYTVSDPALKVGTDDSYSII